MPEATALADVYPPIRAHGTLGYTGGPGGAYDSSTAGVMVYSLDTIQGSVYHLFIPDGAKSPGHDVNLTFSIHPSNPGYNLVVSAGLKLAPKCSLFTKLLADAPQLVFNFVFWKCELCPNVPLVLIHPN
jgi:hypothetical protein